MDSTAKQNLAMFGGAMLSVGTFWLLLMGVTEPNILKLAGGFVCLVGAVIAFRFYREELRADDQE